ncbi:hypothetical protein [Sessilibacter sp. MAH2]
MDQFLELVEEGTDIQIDW